MRFNKSLALFRLTLRSSARIEGLFETRSDSSSSDFDIYATFFIAACARSAWARGKKNLQERRAAIDAEDPVRCDGQFVVIEIGR